MSEKLSKIYDCPVCEKATIDRKHLYLGRANKCSNCNSRVLGDNYRKGRVFLGILILLGILGGFVSSWFTPAATIFGLYAAISSIKEVNGVLAYTGREIW